MLFKLAQRTTASVRHQYGWACFSFFFLKKKRVMGQAHFRYQFFKKKKKTKNCVASEELVYIQIIFVVYKGVCN
jgi:hypothetical protein